MLSAMNEFTRGTIADVETANYLTQAERMALTLLGDTSSKALTLARTGNLNKARIRYAFAELADLNVENVHKWLSEVAQQSPAKAVELFMALAEFTLPKLKAMSVDVRSTDGSVKTMSFSELERIVSEQ
jgi:hypothetical protein